VPLRRGNTGRDGRWALPGLAGVLHRREQLLQPWPGRTGQGRPGRAVLQRDLLPAHARRVGRHRLGRDAPGHRDPGAADAAAARTAGALRRLPHPGRRHRRARPLRTHQAHAARPAPDPLGQAGGQGAQAMGPGRGDRVGARRRTAASLLAAADGARAPAVRRHRLGQPREAGERALRQLRRR
jgi:hypothetical protein